MLLAAVSGGAQTTVKINVLSLFHPRTLVLTAHHTMVLQLETTTTLVAAGHAIVLTTTPAGLLVDGIPTRTLTTPSTTFTLTVPGKLSRPYRGMLLLSSRADTLHAVVAMEVEVAVASIVAAEAPPHAPLEALKAQAIVSRSYLLAHPAHRAQDFDACDTTHCQWMRSPPALTSDAAQATRATRDEVLTWKPRAAAPAQIVAARFSRSCGGRTQALLHVPATSYPFYAVSCPYCVREHKPAAGHRTGLCQLGAADLARRGQDYGTILAHFFPNTAIMVQR